MAAGYLLATKTLKISGSNAKLLFGPGAFPDHFLPKQPIRLGQSPTRLRQALDMLFLIFASSG
ncbi:MAG: hypothetical protein OEN02_12595 [Gammaproteobacteria bacterium]|nr:hypothetical protein [Gammaproteobacteria bacterium]